MEYSCLKTLAGKHESTSRKIIRKYRDGNGGWGVPYQTKAGIKRRSFARFMDCKNTDLWTDKIIDFAIAHVGSRTSFDDRPQQSTQLRYMDLLQVDFQDLRGGADFVQHLQYRHGGV